jgi:hypothetical protein
MLMELHMPTKDCRSYSELASRLSFYKANSIISVLKFLLIQTFPCMANLHFCTTLFRTIIGTALSYTLLTSLHSEMSVFLLLLSCVLRFRIFLCSIEWLLYFFIGSKAPLGPGLSFFSFMIILQTAGLRGRVISSSQGLYPNT